LQIHKYYGAQAPFFYLKLPVFEVLLPDLPDLPGFAILPMLFLQNSKASNGVFNNFLSVIVQISKGRLSDDNKQTQ
jgi:hypothetical protein